MNFLITADKWIKQYAVEPAFLKGVASPALWKLFGCFIVPAAAVSLTLQVVFGERASALFQLFGGMLLAGLFIWRFLVHRRAYESRPEGGAYND